MKGIGIVCSFDRESEVDGMRSTYTVMHLRQSTHDGISPNSQEISVEFGFVFQTLKWFCDALVPVECDDNQACKNCSDERVEKGFGDSTEHRRFGFKRVEYGSPFAGYNYQAINNVCDRKMKKHEV